MNATIFLEPPPPPQSPTSLKRQRTWANENHSKTPPTKMKRPQRKSSSIDTWRESPSLTQSLIRSSSSIGMRTINRSPTVTEHRTPFTNEPQSGKKSNESPEKNSGTEAKVDPQRKKRSLFTDENRKRMKQIERELDIAEEHSTQFRGTHEAGVPERANLSGLPSFPSTRQSQVPVPVTPRKRVAGSRLGTKRTSSAFAADQKAEGGNMSAQTIQESEDIYPLFSTGLKARSYRRTGAFDPDRESSVTAENEEFGYIDTLENMESNTPVSTVHQSPELDELEEGMAMIRKTAESMPLGSYSRLSLQEWIGAGNVILERFQQNVEKARLILNERAQRMEGFTRALENHRESLIKLQEKLQQEQRVLKEGVQASLSGYKKF